MNMSPHNHPTTPVRLNETERWLYDAITHDTHSLRNSPGESSPRAQAVLMNSAALPAIEGLHIYYSAYRERLGESLAKEFPILAELLGKELFNEFAHGYLDTYKPRSYTLAHLGHAFVDYLKETRPKREGVEGINPDWTDFMIDLASFEWAFFEVFDAEGVERGAVLQERDFSVLSEKNFLALHFHPAPSFRLLAFTHPIHRYVHKFREDTHAQVPDPKETFLAVSRQEYEVHIHELSKVRYDLLKGLCDKLTIEQAIKAAATSNGSPDGTLREEMRLCLPYFISSGFIAHELQREG